MINAIMSQWHNVIDRLFLRRNKYVFLHEFHSFRVEISSLIRNERAAMVDEINSIKTAINEKDHIFHEKLQSLEENVGTRTLEIAKAYEDTLSDINKKSQALARIIDKNKKEIQVICEGVKKDYTHLNGIATRLATLDQQIKALQNVKGRDGKKD